MTLRNSVAWVCFMVVAWCVNEAANSQSPAYLTIAPPPVQPSEHVLPGYHTPLVVPLPARGYAYGWFGAQPRAHATRHFGYYRHYTQWSSR